VWTTTLWDHGNQPLQWGVVIGASLVAALFDLAYRRIPNLLTGPVMLGGLFWAFLACGWAGLADSALACGMLLLPFVLLFLLAGGGAGDAKLMGAVGCWLGMRNGLAALMAVCVVGIVVAVAFALAKGRMQAMLRNLTMIVFAALLVLLCRGRVVEAQRFLPATDKMQTMPYGVVIFLGVCLASLGVFLWRA
jgi:prepilin peptidase CpaA